MYCNCRYEVYVVQYRQALLLSRTGQGYTKHDLKMDNTRSFLKLIKIYHISVHNLLHFCPSPPGG